jgi:ligand-binding sensor domain-containing protein
MIKPANLMQLVKIKGANYLLAVLLMAFSSLASAQNQQLHFTHLGTTTGLSDLDVNTILQDKRGFIWVGTADGLNRYDGYKFRVYRNDVKDTTTIGGSYIQDMTEDNDGNLWVATIGGGLNEFDRKTNRFHRYRHDDKNINSISSDFVTRVLIDKYGKVWAATQYTGLDVFDPKRGIFLHYTHKKNDPSSIIANEITAICKDKQENIWVGTANNGLSKFDRATQSFINYAHTESDKGSISGNRVTFIFEDSDQKLWVGTQEAGLIFMINRKALSSIFCTIRITPIR